MFLDITPNVTFATMSNGINTTNYTGGRHFFDVATLNSTDSHDVMQLSTLQMVTSAYTSAHGLLSLIVCAFGIPMNILNITVLTRKHMRTPVNCILTWLAVFDLLTMVSYVPFSLHFYWWTSPWEITSERNCLGWMTFLIFHVDFTATTHTISIWLGVTLAMFRYKHIFSPAKGHLTRVRRLIRARIAVFLVVVASVIVMIPNYLMNRLMPVAFHNPETNVTDIIFVNEPLNLGTPDVKPLAQVNLWLHSALAKSLPCILMVVYGGLLVKTLRTNIRMLARHAAKPSDSFCQNSTNESPSKTQYQHEHLCPPSVANGSTAGSRKSSMNGDVSGNGELLGLNSNSSFRESTRSVSGTKTTSMYLSTPSTSPPNVPKQRCSSTTPLTGGSGKQASRHQDNSRTTRMLLVVITLFLVTELPQGVLIVLSATIPDFFFNVYIPLGDMMDMVALVNNGINFLLYCIMSRDFRTTLFAMVKSTLGSASTMPTRVTTSFYRPSAVVCDQNERSHSTLIVRANDFSS